MKWFVQSYQLTFHRSLRWLHRRRQRNVKQRMSEAVRTRSRSGVNQRALLRREIKLRRCAMMMGVTETMNQQTYVCRVIQLWADHELSDRTVSVDVDEFHNLLPITAYLGSFEGCAVHLLCLWFSTATAVDSDKLSTRAASFDYFRNRLIDTNNRL